MSRFANLRVISDLFSFLLYTLYMVFFASTITLNHRIIPGHTLIAVCLILKCIYTFYLEKIPYKNSKNNNNNANSRTKVVQQLVVRTAIFDFLIKPEITSPQVKPLIDLDF